MNAPPREPTDPAPVPNVTTSQGHDLWALGTVLLGVLIGLALVGQDFWRRGLSLVGLSLLAGAGLRLMLPTRTAGLLVVRGRRFDVAALASLGTVVLVLLATVPTR